MLGYLEQAQQKREGMLARARQKLERRVRVLRPQKLRKPVRRMRSRPVCGARLESGTGQGVLHYAPTNEQGVVFLFGKMAERLGLVVVGLQAAFPDCLAMREIAPGSWQPVTIEFEFESRNFAVHKHPSEGCDLIVCWEHNWKECPARLEVIALKEELKRE